MVPNNRRTFSFGGGPPARQPVSKQTGHGQEQRRQPQGSSSAPMADRYQAHRHDESRDHQHDHSHDHHRHSRGHHHGSVNYNSAFAVGIALNTGFVILEAIWGLRSHSLALLADAGHNLSDILALLLAWIASLLAKRPPTERRTYGLRRSSILAAMFNALFLLVAMGAIGWEAIQRFNQPSSVEGGIVIGIAAVGIVINTATALLFLSGRKGDLNIRGAFLHMTADAVVSAGVVVAGFLILQTGWLWLDPIVSLLIVAVIFVGTWDLLKDSFNLALDAVPEHIDAGAVKAYLLGLPPVLEVHDLHIWAMSTTETALTAHLIVKKSKQHDLLIQQVTSELRHKFRIDHTTLQVEYGSLNCLHASDGSV